jgi:hypothetical protein
LGQKGKLERWKVPDYFHAPANLSPCTEPRCPTNRRLAGSLRSSERFGGWKNLNQIQLQEETKISVGKKKNILYKTNREHSLSTHCLPTHVIQESVIFHLFPRFSNHSMRFSISASFNVLMYIGTKLMLSATRYLHLVFVCL